MLVTFLFSVFTILVAPLLGAGLPGAGGDSLEETRLSFESAASRLTTMGCILDIDARHVVETSQFLATSPSTPLPAVYGGLTDLTRRQEEERDRELSYLHPSILGIPAMPPDIRHRFRVGLSLDGGGVRGLLSAKILERIEELAARESGGRFPRIVDLIDIVGGTSIGGIVASGLVVSDRNGGLPRYNTSFFSGLIRAHGDRIFPRSLERTLSRLVCSPYNPEVLSGILQEQLGEARLTDVAKPLLVTSLGANSKPYIWTTRKAQTRQHSNPLLRELALATSAAPTFFRAASIDGVPMVDGGLFANNPSQLVYEEMKRLWPTVNESHCVVLSIGTGETQASVLPSSPGAIHLPSILDSTMRAQTLLVDELLEATLGERYIRLQTTSSVGLDEATLQAMLRLEYSAVDLERVILPLTRFLVRNAGRDYEVR